jgi:hypothetical protein
MFGSKKDRYIVNLVIGFNLTAIDKWLNGGGEMKNIEKIEKDWKHTINKSYRIDVLPNGRDMYFHREKNLIDNRVDGIDFLENASEDIKRFVKNSKIEKLEWSYWRQYISLRVNDKPILLAPIVEMAELQIAGKLSKEDLFGMDRKTSDLIENKVKVAYSFDSNNKPKEFEEIWRWANAQGVCYDNALGQVRAFVSDNTFGVIEY